MVKSAQTLVAMIDSLHVQMRSLSVTTRSSARSKTVETDGAAHVREPRHGSARRAGSRLRYSHPRGSARETYFAVAGSLGFVLGVAALALSEGVVGNEVDLGVSAEMFLIPGAIVVVLGGGVVGRAYRETRRRPR